VPPPTNSCT